MDAATATANVPTAPIAVEPLYLVHTGLWTFTPADLSGLTHEPEAHKTFDVITDGPYSSLDKANEAAEARLARYNLAMFKIEGPMTAAAIGDTSPTGTPPKQRTVGPVSWQRTITCRDYTAVFGDQQGWQSIVLARIDQMP